ncbi:MAG: hypothetical protein MI922_21725, partial [Bacteroidales bacterium]|nr:hypothetical protein [Bacteroidales bacterium]
MKRALKITICIACLLSISRSVMCNYSKLEFKRINVKHGVPHSIINCISQDEEGYIWIGTEDGLAKYDNRKFKTYVSDKNDSTSITANLICLIFEDSHKNLWIGTKYSLELYNRELDNFRHFHFYQEPGNPERVLVRAICQLNDSTYIVGTDGGGVYSFVFPKEYKSSYPIYNRISGNLDKRISSLAKENDSIFWVGTFCKGLHQINYNTLEIIPKIEDDCQYRLFGEIRTLLNDNDSVLLIGTYGHGLYAYNKTNNLIHHFNKLTGLTSNRIVSIHREDIDKLWVGTDGGGLVLIEDNFTNVRKFEHQGFDDKSLSNNAIYSVFSDREDNIWVGNFMGGINFSQGYNPFGFLRSNPGYENSLSNKIVSTVIEDSKKRIWVGTDGNSLNIFDTSFNRIEKNILPKSLLEKLDNTPVLSIYEDSKNNIWIGTYLKGLFRYNLDDKSLYHYNTNQNNKYYISNDDVRCFFEDNFGRIWIGTNGGGVNLITPNLDSVRVMKRKLGDENTLSLDWIRTIIDDSYGLVWVGTMHGLNYYDPVKDKFIRFINDPEDTN